MYRNLLILALLTLQNTLAFSPSTYICRRNIINIIAKSPALIPFTYAKQSLAQQPVENRPLTPQEMEEYNKLLKEAERIQNIIDLNINASKKLLLQDEENDLERYIRENNIRKK